MTIWHIRMFEISNQQPIVYAESSRWHFACHSLRSLAGARDRTIEVPKQWLVSLPIFIAKKQGAEINAIQSTVLRRRNSCKRTERWQKIHEVQCRVARSSRFDHGRPTNDTRLSNSPFIQHRLLTSQPPIARIMQ